MMRVDPKTAALLIELKASQSHLANRRRILEEKGAEEEAAALQRVELLLLRAGCQIEVHGALLLEMGIA